MEALVTKQAMWIPCRAIGRCYSCYETTQPSFLAAFSSSIAAAAVAASAASISRPSCLIGSS
eukprot:scaffold107676_cov31-Tisochrysis_lutea.AAC.3